MTTNISVPSASLWKQWSSEWNNWKLLALYTIFQVSSKYPRDYICISTASTHVHTSRLTTHPRNNAMLNSLHHALQDHSSSAIHSKQQSTSLPLWLASQWTGTLTSWHSEEPTRAWRENCDGILIIQTQHSITQEWIPGQRPMTYESQKGFSMVWNIIQPN